MGRGRGAVNAENQITTNIAVECEGDATAATELNVQEMKPPGNRLTGSHNVSTAK